MDKEEIKDYLKRVDELGAKLTEEDKETYNWLIYGYNQCAKLLNETKQQCKKQKEVIDKAIDYVENGDLLYLANKCSVIYRDNVEVVSICDRLNELLTKLKEVE